MLSDKWTELPVALKKTATEGFSLLLEAYGKKLQIYSKRSHKMTWGLEGV